MDRKETISRIKTALHARSGKNWSVTGGRGTAYGWITIDAPPSRKTCHTVLKTGAISNNPEDYEEIDTGEPNGYMTKNDRLELQKLLGKSDAVHFQGESIPAGNDYYLEYIDRAEGKTPSRIGQPYWD